MCGLPGVGDRVGVHAARVAIHAHVWVASSASPLPSRSTSVAIHAHVWVASRCPGCRPRRRWSQFTHMCGLPESTTKRVRVLFRRNSRTCVGCQIPQTETKGAQVGRNSRTCVGCQWYALIHIANQRVAIHAHVWFGRLVSLRERMLIKQVNKESQL